MYRNVYDPGPQECCQTCRNWEVVENYCHLKERYVNSGYLCQSYERQRERKRERQVDGHNVQDHRNER